MIAGPLRQGHRVLLVGWRYLPLWVRRIAIRILYPQFPVGAIALIRDQAGRVLLVRQTYHLREQWGAPGGWIADGESPRRAAARETFEETGLRVSIGRVLGVSSGPYGDVSLAFEGRLVEDQALTLSDEVSHIAYFSPNELPPLPRAIRELLREAVATQDALAAPSARPGTVAPARLRPTADGETDGEEVGNRD